MNELKEARRLGNILAGEAPGNREVTRDRILTEFHMATVSTQLGDSTLPRSIWMPPARCWMNWSKQVRFSWFSMWIGWGFQIWMPRWETKLGTRVMTRLRAPVRQGA